VYAQVNGIRLFFDVDGKRLEADGKRMRLKPVCFVLHGGPGDDHSSYIPGLDPLAKHIQLVYIDFRGSGRSDYPDDGTYTLDQNVLDIEALRVYLGLEGIVLFGQSYGGIVAQAYGVRYPENLEGLILLTTASNHGFFDLAREELKRRGSPEQIAMAEKYLWPGAFPDNETYRAYYRLFANLYSLKPADSAAFNEIMGRAILSYKALNRGFGGDLKTFDFRGELHKIACPCLLIGGREDWIVPVPCIEELSEHLGDCEMVIMEEASHIVLGDQYEKTMEVIVSFVKRRLAG
jgi:proline iminopeptidase